jgi:hypothetical protein
LAKPINRFQFQIVLPDGFRWEVTSRRDVGMTAEDVAECLEKYAVDIRKMLPERCGKPRDEPIEDGWQLSLCFLPKGHLTPCAWKKTRKET